MTSSKTGTPVMVTSNPKQPYAFIVTLEENNSKIKIQAKNTETKDAFLGEFNQLKMKKIGYHQSIKGFYNRLRMAIESKAPQELIAYYYIHRVRVSKARSTSNLLAQVTSPSHSSSSLNGHNTNSSGGGKKQNQLVLTLEERNKYDDESQRYSLQLAQLNIKESVKLTEKLGDVAIEVDKKYLKTQKTLEVVIQQVKQKFMAEKEARDSLEQRVMHLESLCKKLTKKCLQLQEQIDLSKHDDMMMPQSPNSNGAGDSVLTLNLSEKIVTCEQHVAENNEAVNNSLSIMNKKLDDIRPKLVRLKTRKDFASEQGFIDYITKKLEQWDSSKYGPILVRVKQNATGKAKHFSGYVGEPQKWNHTICKVQWFGLGKKLPESVEWKALDVFLPLSAFYYPDCPHARSSFQATSKMPERL